MSALDYVVGPDKFREMILPRRAGKTFLAKTILVSREATRICQPNSEPRARLESPRKPTRKEYRTISREVEPHARGTVHHQRQTAESGGSTPPALTNVATPPPCMGDSNHNLNG